MAAAAAAAIQTWVSEHKLSSIGALWASGIAASLAYSRSKSTLKPSLRLIHARMHAQALTLAVLSGAAAYHYYERRGGTEMTDRQADNKCFDESLMEPLHDIF